MPAKIPYPITFNPYKHHFRFLLEELQVWKPQTWPVVNNTLLSIGNNLVDFYTGNLSIEDINTETLNYFTARHIDNYAEFKTWLNALNWKKIVLSDQSEWLIKEGDDPERYIHIHPAKYSRHSIRVRATTLKTVLALEYFNTPIEAVQTKNLEAVNHVRKNFLALSPIKSLQKSESGILHLWELFRNHP